jgi:hypothetical protein
MVPYFLFFYLFACKPSHDFVDESVPGLSCGENECCSDEQLFEIYPTEEQDNIDQQEEAVHYYDLNSAEHK